MNRVGTSTRLVGALLMIASAAIAGASGQSDAEHLATFDRIRQAFDAKDMSAFLAEHAEGVVLMAPESPEPSTGLEPLRAAMGGFFTAFPDARWEVRRAQPADGLLFVEVQTVGTHGGPLMTPDGPIAPSQRPVLIRWSAVFQFATDGRVARVDSYYDLLGILMQVGVIPPPT